MALAGVLILTIVDGIYLVVTSSYEPNEQTNNYYKPNDYEQGLNGPVLFVLVKSLAVIERFIDTHEKLFLVLSTIAIAWFTGTLWRSTSALETAAKKQGEDMRASLVIASESANAALIQANALMSAERGYAKMSHRAPLDLTQIMASIQFGMEIRNWGRTPVQVTDICLFTHILSADEQLPNDPPYGRPEVCHAFLVSMEQFFFIINATAGNHISDVQSGTKTLYLIGYVDYTDKFGVQHRGGYARRYSPDAPDLVFVTQEGYNYDRQRNPKKVAI